MEAIWLVLIVIVNLIFLYWFITTLNRIAGDVNRTAEYVRSLALTNPPSEDQSRVINRQLSLDEVLDRLAARGATVKVRQMPDTWYDLHIDGIGPAEPEMLRIVNERRKDVIQLLLKRNRERGT